MRHDARAVRVPTGWRRWLARCFTPACNWQEWPAAGGGKESAERLAEAHCLIWDEADVRTAREFLAELEAGQWRDHDSVIRDDSR